MKGKRSRDEETKRGERELDKFDLYEWAVTSPEALARFLKAVHGGSARVLGEDFSGTASLSRAWVEMDARHEAVPVDRDVRVVARLERACGESEDGKRISIFAADVMQATTRCDILACTNFPICYWHTRKDLLRYLGHARKRLKRHGVFVADLYGGSDAFTTGSKAVRLRRDGRAIEYIWEQRRADAKTGRVLNAIHFRVGRRVFKDAFVYHWRLWSIPELSEAMREAGFTSVEVYDELGDAVDERGRVLVRPAEELADPYVVYVVARR